MLNIVYAHLTAGAPPDVVKEFDRDLVAPYDWELSPLERRREEARRIARDSGALRGEADALAAMRMRQK